MRFFLLFTVVQPMVVPGESILDDARHLHDSERHRVAGTNRRGIHQTSITRSQFKVSLDTSSQLIVDASHLICRAGRHGTEGLELGAVR